MGKTGPEAPAAPAPLDPGIPTGAFAETSPRPAVLPEPAFCSFREPVCVHRGPGALEPQVIAWLSALERAEERLTQIVGLPKPLPDDDRGGGPEFDLYLTRRGRGVHAEIDAWEMTSNRDAASSFCVGGADEPATDRAATLCIAEAILLGLDASETPFSRRALAAELWNITGTPTSEDAQAIDDFQSHPELATIARERSPLAEGSALWLEFLNAVKGGREPASVALASFSLSIGERSPLGLRLTNEPDTLDVLRTNFGHTPTDFARLFGEFALRRACVGSRDADGFFPEFEWVSNFGRVRFEWSVPASSLPRSLAPSRPVEPTGATYLWVALDGASPPSTLFFVADWETPVGFKWNLALVGRDGKIMRLVDVPFIERGTHVERTLTDLAGGAGVLISGTNLGGIGPTYPFDPDFEPFEPHAYVVSLAKE